MFYDLDIHERNHFTGPSRDSIPCFLPHAGEKEVDFGQPIPFSAELASQLRLLTYNFVSNYELVPIDKSYFTKEIRSELFRFWIALKSYKDSYNPLLSIDELIDGLLEGPEFLVYLKKLRSYHLVMSTGGRFEEDSPDMERIINRSKSMDVLKDIGQIFNVRFYFFWDQPDEEDWKYFFEPVKQISPELLQEVYETTLFLLPEISEVVEEQEVLLTATSSNSKGKDGKSFPNWYLKQKDNYFTNSPLVGHGSYIQKCPGDTRFSVTLSVPHSNTVKLIEKQFSLVAAEMPWSCYVKDPDEYNKRYNKFKDNNSLFYCRDLKKDGITKVRQLLQAVCRALKEKYPRFPACKYLDIYNEFYLVRNGTKEWTPRGVGLGMSSALTTILQSVIFRMTLSRVMEEVEYPVSMDAVIYHDDIAIGANTLNELEDFNDIEDRLFKELSLIKNKRKSFFADWFVLCENYSPEFMDTKDSYEKYLLNLPMACVNISHAKTMFANNLRYIHQADWKKYLDTLVAYWGYEYHPEEVLDPFGFGGWVPAQYMSVDISFLYNENITHLSQAAALAYTVDAPPNQYLDRRIKKEPYLPPVVQVFGSLDYGDAEDYFNIGCTTSEIARQLAGFKKFGSKTQFWKHILSERRSRFKQLMQEPMLDIKSFYEMYCKLHTKKDVFPPRLLLVGEDVSGYQEVESVYHPTNPILQYLAYHNPGKLPNSVIPWPIRPDVSTDKSLQLTAEERLRVQYDPHLLKTYRLGEMRLISIKPRLILSPFWYNPNQMRSAAVALNLGDILPKGSVVRYNPYEINSELFLALSGPCKSLVERVARFLPYQKLVQLIGHFSTLAEEMEPYRNAKLQAIELVRAYHHAAESLDTLPLSISQHSSAQGWSDTPLSDSGYFLWLHTHQKYKDWRNHYFRRIADKFANVELAQISWLTNKNFQDVELDDDLRFDDVERYLYTRSGGTVNDAGFPVLNVSAVPEWGNEGDDKSQSDIFLAEDDEGLVGLW